MVVKFGKEYLRELFEEGKSSKLYIPCIRSIMKFLLEIRLVSPQ